LLALYGYVKIADTLPVILAVSKTDPSNIPTFGELDGICVLNHEEAKVLHVLRSVSPAANCSSQKAST
jgi:hypothetical protein